MTKTPDLATASALLTLGERFSGLERINEKKFNFLFEDSDTIEDNMVKFWNRELLVEPQALFTNSRLLKNKIFNS